MWTEWLVRDCLGGLDPARPFHVLDLCCGTGCVGVAIAKKVPPARVWGVDILPEAVQMSQENARQNGIPDTRYTALQSDFFACFMATEIKAGEGSLGDTSVPCEGPTKDRADSQPRKMQIADAYRHSFDLIVCNPPYVLPAQYDALPLTIKRWESRLALVGDARRESKQYLYFKELCEYGVEMLKPGRSNDTALREVPNLVVEVGLQAEVVASLMEMSKLWENVKVHLDYAQQPRWITATSTH
ncbi:unnamed protein product [Phytomonas sp. Hart1]|nr:unnamed protein product [Phytomonas sp. Hart1]|eukprot:CCW69878.1 unnamed protein product [Phytomonas sp. isolate Hart1]